MFLDDDDDDDDDDEEEEEEEEENTCFARFDALLNILLLKWLYSPLRTFTSLMDFSQSSLQSI
jgi:hypothetical protein